MTFTVIGHCPRTHQIGVGIATYSLAVGGYCPWGEGGLGVLSTQANVNPSLGPVALDALRGGAATQAVMDGLRAADPDFEYRQVGIVSHTGDVCVHTGERTRDWKGHLVGAGFLVMGNVLAGVSVLEAMASAFDGAVDEALEERLLRALEAGRDTGGQANKDGARLSERSAGLCVYESERHPILDLRVDMHTHAVDELRRVHALYQPYVPYYALRHREPANAPPQDAWAQRIKERGG
ncbi:MAG: DUF1028 domain-containing protein [Gammaproteobacteria bacterium]|nr:DUF1028 domain-containing protein [Gammaproteobacteria bacterium]